MRSSRRIARWILAGNLAVACLLVLATLINLHTSRDVDLDRARGEAENLAHAMSLELDAELRLVDNALNTIALRSSKPEAADPGRRLLAEAIEEQALLLPFVKAIRATDADGNVLYGLQDVSKSVSIIDRHYFDLARRADRMVISDPLLSRVFDEWCVVLARPLRSSSGAFRGVVYAVLSARHFQDIFRRFAIGHDGSLALRSQDMRLLARYTSADPDSNKGLGSDLISEELRRSIKRDPELGSYITPTALDGVERVTAYRKVSDYPLTVLAGLSTEHYLAPWRSVVWRHWAFTVAVIAMVMLGSGFLYAQHKRMNSARLQSARLACEQRLLLDNELVGMLRVKGETLRWANRAACQMLGYPAEVLLGSSIRKLCPTLPHAAPGDDASSAPLPEQGRFRTQLKMQCANGKLLWVDLSGAALGEGESIWMLVDIDGLKNSEEQAQHLALHDPLTGLANRRLLEIQLEQALLNARRAGSEVAVGYLDLDGFKPVNDHYGHEAGDLVLRVVAERLSRAVRGNDIVARLGGDEFVLLLSGFETDADALTVLQRCMDSVGHPITLGDGTPVTVGCSMGLARSGVSGDSAEALLAAADAAMYRAKRGGRGRVASAAPASPVALAAA